MKKVKALILAGNGINCEMEMAHVCKLGGADVVDIVYIYDLLSGAVKLDEYHFLNLPGGFLDGDDLGSAKAMAHRLKYARIAGSGERLEEGILRFIREGKLILGVCNGFQLMVKSGLIPGLGGNIGQQTVTLTFNDSGRFEDRWCDVKVHLSPRTPALEGLEARWDAVWEPQGTYRFDRTRSRDEVYSIDTPPPTVSGKKTSSATRRTISAMVLRPSGLAEISRNTSSSAPMRS